MRPLAAVGPTTLQLSDRESNIIVLMVTRVPRSDGVRHITGQAGSVEEPPLSENDPVYFVLGYRDGGWNARFQLSFKYRLFDQSSGFGAEQPRLSGFYFGYTQNSLWDLSSQSKAFRDTSYRPSFFWKWERIDEGKWVDAARAMTPAGNGSRPA